MRMIEIASGEIRSSEIALGCMRIADMPVKDISKLITTAIEEGINFFDHADIYGGGKSEEVFGTALKEMKGIREKIFIQTKCGIRDGYYDFSKDHILEAVDGSLKRLKIDYIDVLLLHRPDALVDPEEVAEAFSILHASGKVRNFGVSNHNPMQIELLSQYLNQRIIVNQLQLSITNTGMIDAGLNVNMQIDKSVDRDGSVLDYCRLNGITIQAWSPFQYGFFDGVFLDNPKFKTLNDEMDKVARNHDVPKDAIPIAWILRHPAKIQPVVGTTNAKRLKEICQASNVNLTKKEWYDLYKAAGNKLP
ncbi:MAG: aldo/keto reductase [Thermotogae bacterium]|jgi:predicted oxidoreductase|nr:aldo/keto reductase [Thermotogota bacterium]